MSDELDKKYQEYAEAFAEKAEIDSKIKNLSRLVDDLKREIKEHDNTGEYGLNITAHACNQISKRLESLAAENSVIFKDVMNMENPSSSLIWPTNMESFVLGMLAKARLSKDFTVEDSKNSSGKEYHYNIEIRDWATENKRLIFTGLVENNNIKTGFFNWTT
jgi:hypothetical protein